MERSEIRRFVGCGDAPGVAGQDRVRDGLPLFVSALVLLAVVAWSYGGTALSLIQVWRVDKDYSAGQLVPLVAVFLVWRQRKELWRRPLAPCWWGGMALLVLAEIARTGGYLFMVWPLMHYSLVLVAAGLVLTVAGRQWFRQVVWILLFLTLMVPLPVTVHNLISGRLQSMATAGSVFLLEAFGTRISRHGNIVILDGHTPIAVAEACSGLRMLTAFIIVAAFIAYMVNRPRWQKTVLLLSSIPVALACNIVRIYITAMLMIHVSAEAAETFFHDFAGLAMMPIAVSLMFGELWLMDRLVEPDSGPARQQTIVRARSGKSAPAPP